jgi:hypothetical protein
MLDYGIGIALLGMCMLWGAWCDYANGNTRDSKLMAGLGVSSLIGSAGILTGAI